MSQTIERYVDLINTIPNLSDIEGDVTIGQFREMYRPHMRRLILFLVLWNLKWRNDTLISSSTLNKM